MPTLTIDAQCPICDSKRSFSSGDDYLSCRDDLRPSTCNYKTCLTRQRALAAALFSLYPRSRVTGLRIHESSPAVCGLSLWLRQQCPHYVMTGYFPKLPLGSPAGQIRNEDLERQTFADAAFDVVIHLDVMEHLFDPFAALCEIERTLVPGGHCLFTAPTYPDQRRSEQVAFKEEYGIRIVGKPEYHGNPHDKAGSLVTWRYGYDLPYLIAQHTRFDVEVRRWYSREHAILGPMTEVYVLSKRS